MNTIASLFDTYSLTLRKIHSLFAIKYVILSPRNILQYFVASIRNSKRRSVAIVWKYFSVPWWNFGKNYQIYRLKLLIQCYLNLLLPHF